GATAPRFRVGIYLSTDAAPGTGTLLGFRDIASLAAGGTSTGMSTLTIPVHTAPGVYFLSAVADIANAATELDETNNGLTASSQQITITEFRADLVVAAVSGPPTAAQGRSITVGTTVRNQGSVGATASRFRVGIYLSSDSTAGSGPLLGF